MFTTIRNTVTFIKSLNNAWKQVMDLKSQDEAHDLSDEQVLAGLKKISAEVAVSWVICYPKTATKYMTRSAKFYGRLVTRSAKILPHLNPKSYIYLSTLNLNKSSMYYLECQSFWAEGLAKAAVAGNMEEMRSVTEEYFTRLLKASEITTQVFNESMN